MSGCAGGAALPSSRYIKYKGRIIDTTTGEVVGFSTYAGYFDFMRQHNLSIYRQAGLTRNQILAAQSAALLISTGMAFTPTQLGLPSEEDMQKAKIIFKGLGITVRIHIHPDTVDAVDYLSSRASKDFAKAIHNMSYDDAQEASLSLSNISSNINNFLNTISSFYPFQPLP